MSRIQNWLAVGAVGIAMLLTMGPSASASILYSNAVLADGPVGYWRLNETGSTATNLGTAGALLNATYNNFNAGGAQGVPGLINDDPDTAADFNGIQSAAGSSLVGTGMNSVGGGNPFANDWTIEAWLTRDAQHQWSGVFSNNHLGLSAPVLTFIDNTHQLGVNGTGVTPNNVSVNLGGLNAGQKIYAVVRKTGGNASGTSSLTVDVNLNGTWLPTSTGTNSGWNFTPQDGFWIGRHYDAATQMHNGIIDEVAIYNRALTNQEILDHYFFANESNLSFVPEPSTACLLLIGAAGLAWQGRRRKQRTEG